MFLDNRSITINLTIDKSHFGLTSLDRRTISCSGQSIYTDNAIVTISGLTSTTNGTATDSITPAVNEHGLYILEYYSGSSSPSSATLLCRVPITIMDRFNDLPTVYLKA